MQAFLSTGTLAISPVLIANGYSTAVWSSTVVTHRMEREGDRMVLPVPNATAFPGSSRVHGAHIPRC